MSQQQVTGLCLLYLSAAFDTIDIGSVLCPLFFILYTAPLSTIISRSSVNYKLYADDTQLFLSFLADAFSEKIQLLQDTISEISSWMASNFLSLNPVKTEFLLIGLPAQLAKILKYIIPHSPFLATQQYNLFHLLEILVLYIYDFDLSFI